MNAKEFKIGDSVVMVENNDYDTVFTIVSRPLRLYHLKGIDDLFYGRLNFQIRHATSSEIKKGRRLNHGVQKYEC